MSQVPKNPLIPPWPAVVYRDVLIERYLRHYTDDASFVNVVSDFAEEHRTALATILEAGRHWSPFLHWTEVEREHGQYAADIGVMHYVDGLRNLAAVHKLDWLHNEIGLVAVHQALADYVRYQGGSWNLLVIEAREFPPVEGVNYQGQHPSVELTPGFIWKPDLQAPKSIRKKLRAATRGRPDAYKSATAHMEAVIANYVDAGYAFPPDTIRVDEHLGWLYRRVVKRDRTEWIAADAFATVGTVIQATKILRPHLSPRRIPHPRRVR